MAEEHKNDYSSLPVETWSVDDLAEMSPSDYLVGCLEKRWQSDPASMEEATACLLSATFAQAGLTPDDAFDKAYDYMERGVTLTWDGRSLGFEFADDKAREVDHG